MSIGALFSAGDAHYIYRNVDSFSEFGPLDCHNRKELVAWLDRIKQESQDAAGFHLIEDPPDQALSASPVGSPLRPANQPPFVAYRSLPSMPMASCSDKCVPSSAARRSESAWHLAVAEFVDFPGAVLHTASGEARSYKLAAVSTNPHAEHTTISRLNSMRFEAFLDAAGRNDSPSTTATGARSGSWWMSRAMSSWR